MLSFKMDKKLVDIRNGDPDLIDEISDAKNAVQWR